MELLIHFSWLFGLLDLSKSLVLVVRGENFVTVAPLSLDYVPESFGLLIGVRSSLISKNYCSKWGIDTLSRKVEDSGEKAIGDIQFVHRVIDQDEISSI